MPLDVGGVPVNLERVGNPEEDQAAEQTRFERNAIETRGKKQVHGKNMEGERAEDHNHGSPSEWHEESQQTDDTRKGIKVAAVRHEEAAEAGLIRVNIPVGAVFRVKLRSEKSVRPARKQNQQRKKEDTNVEGNFARGSRAAQGSPIHWWTPSQIFGRSSTLARAKSAVNTNPAKASLNDTACGFQLKS